MKVKLDKGAFVPVRAHSTDAGADMKSRENAVIRAHDSYLFDTGVHVELPFSTVGMIFPKSGLNCGRCIVAGTGVIDEGYSGSIKVRVYNHGDEDYTVYAGDKIAQLVVMPLYYLGFEVAEDIEGGERGSDGFGSTGR